MSASFENADLPSGLIIDSVRSAVINVNLIGNPAEFFYFIDASQMERGAA